MTCFTSIFAFGGSPVGALWGCAEAQVLQFSVQVLVFLFLVVVSWYQYLRLLWE